MCMEENVKLKVLEKYFKDHLNKDLVVVTGKNYFIGSDKHIYKVYSSKELDDKLNYYLDLLSTHIYNEALLLCKKYGLGDYAKYITINKEMINKIEMLSNNLTNVETKYKKKLSKSNFFI